jgi:hypothetical protein
MLRAMERAHLRPVPTPPAVPVEPAAAVRHVAARLPDLDPEAVRALALVELAGRPRSGLEGDAGEALARARKALRRSIAPLPGSGWCERAERLVSDRLDGALERPGPARLDAHLANCPRCVEHELRLAQATDALLRAFPDEPPAPAIAAERPAASRASLAAAPEATPDRPPPPLPLIWRALLLLALTLAVVAVAIAVVAVLAAN